MCSRPRSWSNREAQVPAGIAGAAHFPVLFGRAVFAVLAFSLACNAIDAT